MKIIILGFDALDYDIVETEGLDGLQQKFYGHLDVSGFKAAEPLIWSTFLTGKDPEEHKIYYFTTTGNRVIEWFKKLFFERLSYSSLTSAMRFYIPLMKMIGIGHRVPDKSDLQSCTIFDLVDKPLPINVMMYNEWKELHELRVRTQYVINDASGDSELIEKVVEEWYGIYYKQKKDFLNSLSEDWDIIMTHVYLADAAGHLYKNQYNKYLDIYKEFNNFSKEVTERVNDSAMILIVSDHGMKKGMHQSRAFYSFNKDPPFLPEKMTDYYNIIRQVALN